MLSALFFVVLLLIALSLAAVGMLWQPGERVTPEKARLIRGSAVAGAIIVTVAAGVVMLRGMKTQKGESKHFEPYAEERESPTDDEAAVDPPDHATGPEPRAAEKRKPGEASARPEREHEVLSDPGPPEAPSPAGDAPDARASEKLD